MREGLDALIGSVEESPAGPEALLVSYRSRDTWNYSVLPDEFVREIAADAARRAEAGWRLASLSLSPARQSFSPPAVTETRVQVALTSFSAVALYRRT